MVIPVVSSLQIISPRYCAVFTKKIIVFARNISYNLYIHTKYQKEVCL